jgi:hypothetical protein
MYQLFVFTEHTLYIHIHGVPLLIINLNMIPYNKLDCYFGPCPSSWLSVKNQNILESGSASVMRLR